MELETAENQALAQLEAAQPEALAEKSDDQVVRCSRCKGLLTRGQSVRKNAYSFLHPACHSLQVYVARLDWPADLAFQGAEKEEFFKNASRCRDPVTGKISLARLRNEVARVLTTRKFRRPRTRSKAPSCH